MALIGSHLGSFGKGRQNLGETGDVLAAQLCIIDSAGNRPRPQDLAGIMAALRRQFEEPLAQRLVRR
jgi:hypothetical protein